jgi:F-type H+-transporting ATPase subunit epsilon
MILNICSPSGVIFENKVKSVTLPSIGGMMTILPMHSNFSAQLTTGILEITAETGEIYKIAINAGIANFEKEELNIATLEAQILDQKNTKKVFDQNTKIITDTINQEIAAALSENQIYKVDPVAINSLSAERQARIKLLNELLK